MDTIGALADAISERYLKVTALLIESNLGEVWFYDIRL
jgi:hypothetical protein